MNGVCLLGCRRGFGMAAAWNRRSPSARTGRWRASATALTAGALWWAGRTCTPTCMITRLAMSWSATEVRHLRPIPPVQCSCRLDFLASGNMAICTALPRSLLLMTAECKASDVQGTMGLCTPSDLLQEAQATHLALRTAPFASGRQTLPPKKIAMQRTGHSAATPQLASCRASSWHCFGDLLLWLHVGLASSL